MVPPEAGRLLGRGGVTTSGGPARSQPKRGNRWLLDRADGHGDFKYLYRDESSSPRPCSMFCHLHQWRGGGATPWRFQTKRRRASRKIPANSSCRLLAIGGIQGCGAVTFLVGSGSGSGSGETIRLRLRLRLRVKLFRGSGSGSGSGQNVPAPAAPAPAPAPMIKSSYEP